VLLKAAIRKSVVVAVKLSRLMFICPKLGDPLLRNGWTNSCLLRFSANVLPNWLNSPVEFLM